MMRKIVYLFICLFVYLFIPLAPIYASDAFDTAYDVQYAVAQTGTTIVTQKITLTNKQSLSYPKQFAITLDSVHITDVIAYDAKGVIHPTITQKDGKTTISLSFNDHVVGIGKTLSFWIRFENADIAKKNGSIWEVNIPGINPSEHIASYSASLQVPPTIGANVYMNPLPANGNTWTKDQLEHGGVKAAYGTQQHMDLTLSYFLKNTNVFPQDMTFALPPDTPYQSVYIKSLTPLPKQVAKDPDGNYIASYALLPGQQLTVNTTISLTMHDRPKEGSVEHMGTESLYLQGQRYWETTDPAVKQIAAGLHTPQDVYTYVVAALSYDYTRAVQNPIRKGAKAALATPEQSVCMEFTDLFVALARAAGIPAREVVGFAYSNNPRLRPLSLESERLHTWPEYYDREKSVWIAVDPTWADTTGGLNYFDTLDFNHVALAIHGLVSDSPYPVGYFPKPGVSNDIQVSFPADTSIPSVTKTSVTINFPASVGSGAVYKGSIVVRNMSGVLSTPLTLSLQSVPVDLARTEKVSELPPYGQQTYEFSLALPSVLVETPGRIVAQAGVGTATLQFDIQPYSYYSMLPFVSLFVMVAGLFWGSYKYTPLWKRFKRR